MANFSRVALRVTGIASLSPAVRMSRFLRRLSPWQHVTIIANGST
jgi:hypothetical protein